METIIIKSPIKIMLCLIKLNKEKNISQISKELGISSSNINEYISKLRQAKLITFKMEDKRSKILKLTKKGRLVSKILLKLELIEEGLKNEK